MKRLHMHACVERGMRTTHTTLATEQGEQFTILSLINVYT